VVIKGRYRRTSPVHQNHLWSRRCLAIRKICERFAVPSLFATHPSKPVDFAIDASFLAQSRAWPPRSIVGTTCQRQPAISKTFNNFSRRSIFPTEICSFD
jgi:hypothetical protein